MTKQPRDFFIWVGLCALVLGGMIFAFNQTRPTSTQIESAVRPLSSLPKSQTVFSKELFEQLDQRVTHGTLPVSPAPPAIPKDDPFL